MISIHGWNASLFQDEINEPGVHRFVIAWWECMLDEDHNPKEKGKSNYGKDDGFFQPC
jgi:hypothetical protein